MSDGLRSVATVINSAVDPLASSIRWKGVDCPLHKATAGPVPANWGIAEALVEEIGEMKARAYIKGCGSEYDQPRGLLTYRRAVEGERRPLDSFGCVTVESLSALRSDPEDAFTRLMNALDGRYQRGACFLMSPRAASLVRRLQGRDGRFLWSDSPSGGRSNILGAPVAIERHMPRMEGAGDPIAFGDFSAAYLIAEEGEPRVAQDAAAFKPRVAYYAKQRVGGIVADFAAVKFLRILGDDEAEGET